MLESTPPVATNLIASDRLVSVPLRVALPQELFTLEPGFAIP